MDPGDTNNPEMPKGTDKKKLKKSLLQPKNLERGNLPGQNSLRLTVVLLQPIATEKTEAISTLRQHRLNGQPSTLPHRLGGIKEDHVWS